jgi:4-hydroxy-tetrahydrodipicolinate synthase
VSVEGILPVIPTPFKDGRFDQLSFERLLDSMLPYVDGFTLLGSTGEAPSLPTEERKRIAEAALRVTPEEKAVIVGVTHTAVEETVTLANHAQSHGARGVLCASPFYFPNTTAGILRFLKQLDAVLEVELVLYDNPSSTRTVLQADAVIGWSRELEHLQSVKLTDHDLSKIEAWQAAGLSVLAGDDPILFRFLNAGVDGAMVIAPCLFPAAFHETWVRVRTGDIAGALALFSLEILPFLHVFGIGDEIATAKTLLTEVGVFASAEVLPPLVQVTAERRELLLRAYQLVQAQSLGRESMPTVT